MEIYFVKLNVKIVHSIMLEETNEFKKIGVNNKLSIPKFIKIFRDIIVNFFCFL